MVRFHAGPHNSYIKRNLPFAYAQGSFDISHYVRYKVGAKIRLFPSPQSMIYHSILKSEWEKIKDGKVYTPESLQTDGTEDIRTYMGR